MSNYLDINGAKVLVDQTKNWVREEIASNLDDKVNKAGDTISGNLNIEGALTLPNSPTTPDEVTVTGAYSTRKTANVDTTSLEIVDNGATSVSNIAGNTVAVDNVLKNAFINRIQSTGRNLFNSTQGWQSDQLTISGEVVTILSSVSYVNYCTTLGKGTYTLSGTGGDLAVEVIHDGSIVNAAYAVTLTGGATFSVPNEGDEVRIYFYSSNSGVYSNIMLNYGSTALAYESYIKSIYQLPETVELAKWDRIEPQAGLLIRGTCNYGSVTASEIQKYAWAENIYYISLSDDIAPIYSSEIGDGVCNQFSIVNIYPGELTDGQACLHIGEKKLFFYSTLSLEEVQAKYSSETILLAYATVETRYSFGVPLFYKVWKNGSETIIQGNTDNSAYGAMPTVTQSYMIMENPTEAANKAYVNNGLAKTKAELIDAINELKAMIANLNLGLAHSESDM